MIAEIQDSLEKWVSKTMLKLKIIELQTLDIAEVIIL